MISNPHAVRATAFILRPSAERKPSLRLLVVIGIAVTAWGASDNCEFNLQLVYPQKQLDTQRYRLYTDVEVSSSRLSLHYMITNISRVR